MYVAATRRAVAKGLHEWHPRPRIARCNAPLHTGYEPRGRPRQRCFVRSMIRRKFREASMSDGPDHTRRWLINASSAAILSTALAGGSVRAQVPAAPALKAAAEAEHPAADPPISPISTRLS